MATKTLQTRIMLKYDLLENWVSNNPVLLKGEAAVVAVPSTPTQTVNSVTAPQILMKYGDGTSTFTALPYASALAADVYSWAKSATPGDAITLNVAAATADVAAGGTVLTGAAWNAAKNTIEFTTGKLPAAVDISGKLNKPNQEEEIENFSWFPSERGLIACELKINPETSEVYVDPDSVHVISGTSLHEFITLSDQDILDQADNDIYAVTRAFHENPGDAGKTIVYFSYEGENNILTPHYDDIYITESQVSDLTDDLDNKADKVAPAAANNIAVLNAAGNLVDGGKTITQIEAEIPTGALASKDKVTNDDISGTIQDAHIASAATWNNAVQSVASGNTTALTVTTTDHAVTVTPNTGAVSGNDGKLVTAAQVKDYVDNQISGLGTAVSFVGESTTNPATAGAAVVGHTDWKRGEVVLYGNKEYILTGDTNVAANWVELGDEGSYALKTVTITGTGYLTGGGDLTANRTIDLTKATKDKIDGAIQEIKTYNYSPIAITKTGTTVDLDLSEDTKNIIENAVIKVQGWNGINAERFSEDDGGTELRIQLKIDTNAQASSPITLSTNLNNGVSATLNSDWVDGTHSTTNKLATQSTVTTAITGKADKTYVDNNKVDYTDLLIFNCGTSSTVMHTQA